MGSLRESSQGMKMMKEASDMIAKVVMKALENQSSR